MRATHGHSMHVMCYGPFHNMVAAFPGKDESEKEGDEREKEGGDEREKRENQAEILLPFVANLIQGIESFNKLRQFQKLIQPWCWRGDVAGSLDCTSAWKAPPCHSRSGICIGVSTSGKCILPQGD